MGIDASRFVDQLLVLLFVIVVVAAIALLVWGC